MPGSAPGNSISDASRPYLSFTTAFCPPMVFAEPCSTLMVVTPPASARRMFTAVGLSTSWMRTIDVTESEPSLVASLIMCECGSMMPGITHLPVPSITVAPAGAERFFPICAILPF